jgi:hypothetical protein
MQLLAKHDRDQDIKELTVDKDSGVLGSLG